MKVHFIAVGGSAMHNLAIALHRKGYEVTGSDDEIFDPARTRLADEGILPSVIGWDRARITDDIDAIVVGMHARGDNEELLEAQRKGIKIYSYPEFLYEQSKDKVRIVVGGSHGKTTTTAMILHALRYANIEADYMVGAQLKGFDVMVRLTNTAKVMVIEGDEYLTSPLDPRPKFHLYRPNVALITGIEWDHVNVFPTFDIYKEQFAKFIDLIEPQGRLIYCAEDEQVNSVVAANNRKDIDKIPYAALPSTTKDGTTYMGNIPLHIFGHHNMLNLSAARKACESVGVAGEMFNESMRTFMGAAKRLELVKTSGNSAMYKDFAHAPSKLRATIHAMREQYPNRRLVACMELHTYSSLTASFLSQYRGTMAEAEMPIVYYSEHAIRLKHLPDLTIEQVKEAFNDPRIKVFTDSQLLLEELKNISWQGSNLLMMSSGNFDGIDFSALAEQIIK